MCYVELNITCAQRVLLRTDTSPHRSCPELTGGGLIRSAGGRHAVKEAYRDGIRISGDERIPGSSDFVETTLKHSGEVYRRRLKTAGIDLTAAVAAACRYLQVGEKELESTTRRLEIARARALASHIATRELSIPGSEVALRFHIHRSAVSKIQLQHGCGKREKQNHHRKSMR
jgi:hypothetical protein